MKMHPDGRTILAMRAGFTVKRADVQTTRACVGAETQSASGLLMRFTTFATRSLETRNVEQAAEYAVLTSLLRTAESDYCSPASPKPSLSSLASLASVWTAMSTAAVTAFERPVRRRESGASVQHDARLSRPLRVARTFFHSSRLASGAANSTRRAPAWPGTVTASGKATHHQRARLEREPSSSLFPPALSPTRTRAMAHAGCRTTGHDCTGRGSRNPHGPTARSGLTRPPVTPVKANGASLRPSRTVWRMPLRD